MSKLNQKIIEKSKQKLQSFRGKLNEEEKQPAEEKENQPAETREQQVEKKEKAPKVRGGKKGNFGFYLIKLFSC